MSELLDVLSTNALARLAVGGTAGLLVGLLVSEVVGGSFRAIARRRGWPQHDVSRTRRPFRALLVLLGAWAGANVALLPAVEGAAELAAVVDRVLSIAAIAASAWFLTSIVGLATGVGLERARVDVPDNRVARRIRTQVLIIRRVAVAIVVVLALAAILLSFPGARAAGASLLASAGLVSIIAGLAAQSTLGNVIAGMQLAFSGAIRVDDVVIAEEQWGRIEEITLTYVVVHIWDDRRLVLPSTYFTTTPFENWTRTKSELLGAVEFDLDWRVAPDAMRERLHRVLETTDLWDGRTAVLQVTDAVGGFVRIRVLVSAVDAGTLFDLRCHVREELVTWLHEEDPVAMPRTRVQVVGAEPPVAPRSHVAEDHDDRSLFSGTAPAQTERGNLFTGPVGTVDLDERDDSRDEVRAR